MIKEAIKERYGYNTPVFTKEILALFPMYSSVYVFRKLKEEKVSGKILSLDRGIYYLPLHTEMGLTRITAKQVMDKRYIESNGEIYGIYSGYTLQNEFNITTQIPNVREIVSNNESARCREVIIDGMKFIVHKSRTEITKDNVAVYRVLQLFSEHNGILMNGRGLLAVHKYIEQENITLTDILNMSKYFPARTLKNMVNNGII